MCSLSLLLNNDNWNANDLYFDSPHLHNKCHVQFCGRHIRLHNRHRMFTVIYNLRETTHTPPTHLVQNHHLFKPTPETCITVNMCTCWKYWISRHHLYRWMSTAPRLLLSTRYRAVFVSYLPKSFLTTHPPHLPLGARGAIAHPPSTPYIHNSRVKPVLRLSKHEFMSFLQRFQPQQMFGYTNRN